MYNNYILSSSSIILLVSLFQRINCDLEVIKEQKEIASRHQYENNFTETPGESIITTAITVDDEKFDDNELRKLFVENFKLYENLERERNKNSTLGTVRQTRDSLNDTSKYGVECLSCYSNESKKWDDCYKADKPERLKKIKCLEAEQCYTEIHPKYIRRGCIMLGRLNKTFHCKCPMCNDKPASDHTYYEYKTLGDWAYDNHLLQKPMKGVDVACKVCATTGTNALSDKNCRLGKSADYMVCGANQLCFVNIDEEFDHVSRGCKSRPAYNSFYHMCNKSLCNSVSLFSPILDMKYGDEKIVRFGSRKIITAHRSRSTLARSEIYLIISALLLQIKLFF